MNRILIVGAQRSDLDDLYDSPYCVIWTTDKIKKDGTKLHVPQGIGQVVITNSVLAAMRVRIESEARLQGITQISTYEQSSSLAARVNIFIRKERAAAGEKFAVSPAPASVSPPLSETEFVNEPVEVADFPPESSISSEFEDQPFELAVSEFVPEPVAASNGNGHRKTIKSCVKKYLEENQINLTSTGKLAYGTYDKVIAYLQEEGLSTTRKSLSVTINNLRHPKSANGHVEPVIFSSEHNGNNGNGHVSSGVDEQAVAAEPRKTLIGFIGTYLADRNIDLSRRFKKGFVPTLHAAAVKSGFSSATASSVNGALSRLRAKPSDVPESINGSTDKETLETPAQFVAEPLIEIEPLIVRRGSSSPHGLPPLPDEIPANQILAVVKGLDGMLYMVAFLAKTVEVGHPYTKVIVADRIRAYASKLNELADKVERCKNN